MWLDGFQWALRDSNRAIKQHDLPGEKKAVDSVDLTVDQFDHETTELLLYWRSMDESSRQELLAYTRRRYEPRSLQHQADEVPYVQDK